jgi:DNA-binding SARP family transcriptional activator/tetratricopeptide (TPR) repeat protein
MDFRLLGPLEVRDHDRALALGGPRQRALLAVLLLHANSVVSSDRLAYELWGDQPPATLAKSLQVTVSRLRRVLGDGRLVTQAPGYLLRVEHDELDAARFERLVSEADAMPPAMAAQQLRDAVGLWRGPVLADLADESFAQAACARLEEQRICAIEDRIGADASLGRHAELVGELEALVRAHPLRERLRARLILCLYRCGRQAEALAAYRQARAVLVEELGIEPSREVRELHDAILRQDAALDLAPDSAATSPAFVGRGPELAQLTAAMDEAVAGHGGIVLLTGEPGIGKSRLAEELVLAAERRKARVLVGRCWEAGGAPAYWPWVQSLRTYTRGLDDDTLRARVADGGPALAQILPELRDRLPDLPEPPSLEAEGTRFRLFEAVTGLLRRASRNEPLLLVLDDLHAADEPSLLLLRYVTREVADCRVLVLGAMRDVDPIPQRPLDATLAALVREPNAARVALAGLAGRDVAAYIGATTGADPEPVLAEAIHERTDGNPLFVVELVRLLGSDGTVEHIPPGVRAVIEQRVGRLSDPTRAVLDAASILGREFDLSVLAGLCDLARDVLLDRLDPAVAQLIVDAVPGTPGRLRFSHALVRDTLYDDLTATRRLAMHARAARALEAAGADRPTELASHHLAAGATDDAIRWSRSAGDRAAAQLAHEEAVRLYEQALGLTRGARARCELLLAIGEVSARAGDSEASKRAYREAAELATTHDLRDELAQAALGYGGRIIWNVSRDDPLLAVLLERALAALPAEDSATRVRLLVRLAGGPLRASSASRRRRRAMSAEALEIARRLDDDETRAYGLHGYILGHHGPSHTRRQLALAAELIDVATRLGDGERVVDGLEEHLVAATELGDLPTAEADLRRMADVVAELRQPAQAWLLAVYLALFALLRGEPDAEARVESARALGLGPLSWNAEVTYRLQLSVLRRDQGRIAEACDVLRASVVEFPTYAVFRCALAQAAAELGDDDEALRMVETEPPLDEEWLVGTTLLAEAAARLRQAERSRVLRERLLPYADRLAVCPPEICVGAVARPLALLETDARDADRHRAFAAELHERIGARPWLERMRG